jgi:molybdopterin molybdotransferase
MAIGFYEARNIALRNVNKIVKKEVVDIKDALNRVLASDIFASRDLPPFDNSAMDGFAFRYKDINKRLKVVATIYAGDIVKPILKDSECYKIMTGAKVPRDSDIVVPIENCNLDGDYVEILNKPKKGNAIRLKGEELKSGTLLLKAGEILTFQKIALLASQGITKVECYKRLKIAIIASGDEIREPWEEASSDEIYNINSINIEMLLKSYGYSSSYLGRLADNLDDITNFIAKLKEYDAIVTTGGISAGDADFTKEAFEKNGLKELFHGVRVKPGHPTMFGKMDRSFIFAMPGNPLAAILNFVLLALPTIAKMQGVEKFNFKRCKAKMTKELKLKSKRANIVLGTIKDGYFYPYKDNKYGSGMIMPLVESSAIAIFDEGVSLVEKDSNIELILL